MLFSPLLISDLSDTHGTHQLHALAATVMGRVEDLLCADEAS